MSPRLELNLAPGPEAAAAARIALDDLESGLSRDLLKDVRLMVSELVTNSIRHAGVGFEDAVRLRAWRFAGHLRIEVTDGGPGFEAVPMRGRPDGGGWGLYIVQTLADRWGVERRDGRTCAWFEIDVESRLQRTYAQTG